MNGSAFDIADEAANDEAFERPGASRSTSAFPQIRFVCLVENGTHMLFGSQMASYATDEVTLGEAVLADLEKGMLCLADRNFFAFTHWTQRAGFDVLRDHVLAEA